jgi:hypothetical protein
MMDNYRYLQYLNQEQIEIDASKSSPSWWIRLLLKLKPEYSYRETVSDYTENVTVYKKLGGICFVVAKYGLSTIGFPPIEIKLNNKITE